MSPMRVEKKIHVQSETWEKVKRKRAQRRSDVNIGKKGVTEELLREIKNRLKREGVVKVRILKSALEVTGLDRRSLAKLVADKLGARLVEVRGRTFILARIDDGRKHSIVYKNPNALEVKSRRR